MSSSSSSRYPLSQDPSLRQPQNKGPSRESSPSFLSTPVIPSAAEGHHPQHHSSYSRHGTSHSYEDNIFPSIIPSSTTTSYHENTSMSHTKEKSTEHTDETRPAPTPLQLHVEFFDLNKDGRISPLETFLGFRALGFNVLISFLAIFLINLPFFYSTQESWIPDPRMYMYLKKIHRNKHGSDSGVYDIDGKFRNDKFEELFTRYSRTGDNFLTFTEAFKMTEEFRQPFDFFGWFASKLEFGLFFLLRGRTFQSFFIITKEDLRSCYDGSIFYKAKEENKILQKKQNWR